MLCYKRRYNHESVPLCQQAHDDLYRERCGTLTIQSADSNATWTFTDVDGLTIDSEQMLCYSGTESKNDTVSGDGFPLLYPGDNIFTFTGDITAVAVLPRWCSI